MRDHVTFTVDELYGSGGAPHDNALALDLAMSPLEPDVAALATRPSWYEPDVPGDHRRITSLSHGVGVPPECDGTVVYRPSRLFGERSGVRSGGAGLYTVTLDPSYNPDDLVAGADRARETA